MSPRAVGAVYLIYFVAAVGGALIAKVDAHAGVAIALLANAIYLALTALLYVLFEPVNRSLSLVAAFFGLGGAAFSWWAASSS